MLIKIIIVIASLLVIVSSLVSLVNKPNYIDPYEQVIDVIDGDTFVLQNNKPLVRLYGLNAPDLPNCYGQESLARLEELLKGGRVQLKEPVGDKYGRIVALVYVNGQLINDILLKEGLAVFSTEYSSVKEQMRQSNDYAKAHHLGIYSPICTQPTPPNSNCLVKGNHDIDKNQNLYFTPDCPHYNYVLIKKYEGDRWFCDEKEALSAGFTQSPDCLLRKKL